MTVASRPNPRHSSGHCDCVAPAQKPSPRHATSKPRQSGKQYVQALRAQRSVAPSQHKVQPKARQNAAFLAHGSLRSKRDTNPPIAGKWVFIPNKRETRTKPRRSAPKETAMPSHLAAQATAVLMFVIFIAKMCIYAREPAQHFMN